MAPDADAHASQDPQGVPRLQGQPPTARLFLALWPPASVREALLARRDAAQWPCTARPTPAERLHLTLHFIGAVPRPRLAALGPALAVPAEPFEIVLDRTVLWSNGIAALLPATVPDALQRLHARLAGSLDAAALPVDARPYRPHVTLARRAAGVVFGEAAAVRWAARGYVLAESAAGYHVVHRYG